MSKNQFSVKVLDIAILTAGRVDLFDKCIDSILPQMKAEYRIHVYNNGEPSTEYEEVYGKLPKDSIVKRSNENRGYGYGANSAIKSGNAPLILFISDDIFLHEGAIDALLKRMEDKSIGICGYKFLFPADSSDPSRPAGKVQHVGQSTNIKGEIFHPLMGWSPENPKCNISRDVFSVTGASFMVRRDVFNRAGGFNSSYGLGYFEDVDLCLTIRSQGKRVFIETGAVADHGVGQTFKERKNDAPPPIQQNQAIFRSRQMKNIYWSELEIF